MGSCFPHQRVCPAKPPTLLHHPIPATSFDGLGHQGVSLSRSPTEPRGAKWGGTYLSVDWANEGQVSKVNLCQFRVFRSEFSGLRSKLCGAPSPEFYLDKYYPYDG